MDFLRSKQRAWIVILALWLLCSVGACKKEVKPPPPTWPSIVTTDDRVQFYVKGLRVPGTRQEIRARRGGASLWIPLYQISAIRFISPAVEDYREAEITLSSGETIKVEVQAETILEGNTEAGYWNMPLSQVFSIEMGTE